MSSLASYENDLAAWVCQQVGYLKSGQYDKIDMENFIEEIEGVVRSEKRSMKSHFIVLITHLLKWEYQSYHRSRSWVASITNSRCEIQEVVEDSPSLKNHMQTAFEQAWERGRKIALQETGIPSHQLPMACPWSLHHVMNKAIAID